jgi:hypothetical protein
MLLPQSDVVNKAASEGDDSGYILYLNPQNTTDLHKPSSPQISTTDNRANYDDTGTSSSSILSSVSLVKNLITDVTLA